MGTHSNRLSNLRLKLLVMGFVQIRLKVRNYRIVSVEDYGNHWRVKIVYSNSDEEHLSSSHVFAINHQGRLIGERAC